MNPLPFVHHPRPWTDQEQEILQLVYPHYPTKDIARIMVRSYDSISSRAHLMGLKKQKAININQPIKSLAMKGEFFIVRANRAGVFFGKISENKGTSVVMEEVRKIHWWTGAAAVEQIALSGVGSGSRLTVTIPTMEIAEPIQIIPCSEAATDNLKNFTEWKA